MEICIPDPSDTSLDRIHFSLQRPDLLQLGSSSSMAVLSHTLQPFIDPGIASGFVQFEVDNASLLGGYTGVMLEHQISFAPGTLLEDLARKATEKRRKEQACARQKKYRQNSKNLESEDDALTRRSKETQARYQRTANQKDRETAEHEAAVVAGVGIGDENVMASSHSGGRERACDLQRQHRLSLRELESEEEAAGRRSKETQARYQRKANQKAREGAGHEAAVAAGLVEFGDENSMLTSDNGGRERARDLQRQHRKNLRELESEEEATARRSKETQARYQRKANQKTREDAEQAAAVVAGLGGIGYETGTAGVDIDSEGQERAREDLKSQHRESLEELPLKIDVEAAARRSIETQARYLRKARQKVREEEGKSAAVVATAVDAAVAIVAGVGAEGGAPCVAYDAGMMSI
mmetsp:Transcript_36625/g.74359  ORF Transcript_36625/g.74359 Transcript_36625/m.74359 type:complete len:410 (-) Transcript_36625:88-1317(-)